MIHSSLLSELDWLKHGFGTRAAALSQVGMATLKQIHSARVLAAKAPGLIGEGDALVTDLAGVTVSVRTADCYPILLVDTDTRVVAAITPWSPAWRRWRSSPIAFQRRGKPPAPLWARWLIPAELPWRAPR